MEFFADKYSAEAAVPLNEKIKVGKQAESLNETILFLPVHPCPSLGLRQV